MSGKFRPSSAARTHKDRSRAIPPTLDRHLMMRRYWRAHRLYLRHTKRAKRVAPAARLPMPGVEQEKRRRLRDVFRRRVP